MQLRSKILAILSFVVGSYLVSDYVIKQMTVVEGFRQLEEDMAQETTVRVKAGLESELASLDGRALNWAQRDGLARFLGGESPDFAERSLYDGVLTTESLDLLMLCDAKGSVVWGAWAHPDRSDKATKRRLSILPTVGAAVETPLLTGWRLEDQARGILRAQRGFLETEHGPLLLATQPVHASGGGGTKGVVLLGRFLGRELIEDLERGTEATNLAIGFQDGGAISAAEAAWLAGGSGEPLIEARDEDWLQVSHRVTAGIGEQTPGMGDAPDLILRAEVPRDITSFGAAVVRGSMVSTLVAGLVILFVLIGLLQKIVLSPIFSLMRNAVLVGEDDTADVRFELDREDEIGVLSREFDQMMEKLAESRGMLVDTAREAGKSEIATGILHNIGNVLNSVNVSSTVLAKKTEELAVQDLVALNGIIIEHAEDLAGFIEGDPRGQHFQPFLAALTEQISQGKQNIAEELASLTQGIDRIRDLVNSQQDYVTRAEVVESCDLPALMERALKVSGDVDRFHQGYEIIREFEDLPRVPIDRYKTLEVLVNLIQNARQAMEEARPEVHQLTLRIFATDETHIRIEVQDTGCGIEPGDLRRIFDHGYTTKPSGHGFGLHSAANAATEMHGSLRARSDGPGTGATFTLELPTRVLQPSRAQL